ncbi:MAG: hypothetical protein DBX55_03010 [Verrucomicrobia bacterium]|nr:MAG: hypothetical protein DBX55_03010 [Verrucomicrobiota bacterium]
MRRAADFFCVGKIASASSQSRGKASNKRRGKDAPGLPPGRVWAFERLRTFFQTRSNARGQMFF